MRVLKLDVTYTPIEIISWEDAFKLIFLNKAEVIEEYNNKTISTPHKKYVVPAVIRVKKKVLDKNRTLNFSRSNIFLRDAYTCQYCGGLFECRELTLDHILPASRGGKKTWTNIVSACHSCNNKKDDKTPKEARMKLLKDPIQPSWTPKSSLKIKNSDPEIWKMYVRY